MSAQDIDAGAALPKTPRDYLPLLLPVALALAAGEYAAHECEADLALFKRFRNARNDVTHGHSIDRATLPGTEARNLFEKYLELISASELSSS